MATTEEFDGAKVALFLGRRLLIIRRDDRPDIADPGMWDFPGGGREGDETPFQTIARETSEEVGLVLIPACVLWRRRFATPQGLDRWFFVARLPARMETDVVFGDEGQGWRLADVPEVLALPDMAGALQQRLALWLAGEAACDAAPAGLPV